MRKFTVLFVCVLVLGAVAMAQMEAPRLEVPKTEFYLGYAYQHADTSGSKIVDSTNLNGFAFEFSHYLKTHNLGFTFDINRTTNSRVNSTGIKYTRTTYLVGPTYRFHDIGFLTVNVHALAGVDRDNFDVTVPGSVVYYKNTDAAAAAGVTVDGNLSRHLGIRLGQIDYLYTNHNNGSQGSFRYTGGVVVRF